MKRKHFSKRVLRGERLREAGEYCSFHNFHGFHDFLVLKKRRVIMSYTESP
ncbi:MAG: hypothetical protein JSV08_09450 [Acidobacteriota bacterium]|nr:MAG: hypothetical protein JSV08_09450 [Acidobacteriota bacterium]